MSRTRWPPHRPAVGHSYTVTLPDGRAAPVVRVACSEAACVEPRCRAIHIRTDGDEDTEDAGERGGG